MADAQTTIIAHLRAGRLDAASAAADEALHHHPADAALHQLHGIIATQQRQFPAAVARFQRALSINPDWVVAHSNLAFALLQSGRPESAVDHARRAIAQQPALPEPHTHLGHALQALDQLPAAIDSHRAALALGPTSAPLIGNLASALQAAGMLDEAIQLHRRATALEPAAALHWTNLGAALHAAGDTHAAIIAHRRALRLDPAFAPAHTNLGVSLLASGAVDDAVAAHRGSIALQPNSPQAHVNLSLALMLRGDWAQGWREYEWRWRSAVFTDARRRFPQPRWDGSPGADRTVLLHAEQGLGDTLQFLRYVPLAASRARRIKLEVQPDILPLLRNQSWANDIELLTRRGNQLPAASFDLHLPLMSLPYVLECETPAPSPAYLRPDPAQADSWRARLSKTHGLKVGLVWAGSPTHGDDRRRSIALRHFATLCDTFGPVISLQRGVAADEAAAPPPGIRLIESSADLHDFADTAALVAQLDAVIAVDTAVAHLAGAMGKQVGLLLPFAPDFRWGLHAPATPWYPTMCLFRQSTAGVWDEPISYAAQWLSTLPSPGTPGEG